MIALSSQGRHFVFLRVESWVLLMSSLGETQNGVLVNTAQAPDSLRSPSIVPFLFHLNMTNYLNQSTKREWKIIPPYNFSLHLLQAAAGWYHGDGDISANLISLLYWLPEDNDVMLSNCRLAVDSLARSVLIEINTRLFWERHCILS